MLKRVAGNGYFKTRPDTRKNRDRGRGRDRVFNLGYYWVLGIPITRAGIPDYPTNYPIQTLIRSKFYPLFIQQS